MKRTDEKRISRLKDYVAAAIRADEEISRVSPLEREHRMAAPFGTVGAFVWFGPDEQSRATFQNA